MTRQTKIGYQLYSARDHCGTAKGLENTIRKIAAIGYDGVEFAGYSGLAATDVKKLLDECAIEAVNAHVPLDRWQDALDEEIAYAKEAGIPMITVPWLSPENRTAASYKHLAENLPGWVARVRASGLRAGYHNHDFEYERVNGKPALEILLESSPDLLYELDVFWAYYADFSPAGEMEKWKGRLGPVHIKDYTDMTTDPPVFCAIGRGMMDLAPVFAKAREMALDWLVVEQDNSVIDVFESAALSLETARERLQAIK